MYMAGMTSRIMTVEVIVPPMTVIAKGPPMLDPDNARGSKTSITARLTISIAFDLTLQASTIESSRDTPSFCLRLA